ncbi:MAG: lytic transglycosylase domain-containing protein [Bacteroidales bacterium]|nr:lytic transglycosylase domain-containing protein [Bacteroidales bacterium]
MMKDRRVKRGRARHLLFLALFLATGSMAIFVATTGYSEGVDDDPVEPFNRESFAVFGVEMPEQVTFAGEVMPLDLFDVKEAMDRELLSNTYFHSQTIRLIKMANRYFPQIEPVLKKNLVPDDFKYLAVAESGLTQAVSPVKAVGFWQLMHGTAQEYGLEVNDEVDERYHISRSTEVACKYLIESYRKYGNWTMTAASYNAGRRGVDRQILRQKKDNYYDLLLNEETARYVYRVVAFKLIFEDPAAFGFNLTQNDLYPEIPVYTVNIDSTVADFADFAEEHDTNYKMLKNLNPWLRENKLTNSRGRTYEIVLPESGYRRPDAWEPQ